MARYEYDAYGQHTVRAESGFEALAGLNPYRYRGYVYDAETNLYATIERYYDPETGRFLSADTVENAELQADMIGGYNLYAFCLNNPLAHTDPTGGFIITLFLLKVLKVAIIGAVIGDDERVCKGDTPIFLLSKIGKS